MIRILSVAFVLLAAAVFWFRIGPGAEAAGPGPKPPQPIQKGPEYPFLRCRDLGKGLPQEGEWRGKPLIADLDGDGKPDLAASVRRLGQDKIGDGLHVWLNGGAGNWLACDRGLATDMGYGGVDAGDVNGDGHVDLVYSGHDHPPRLFLGFVHDADQREWVGLETIHDLPVVACADVALGDYDGDGHPDLAVVGWSTGGLCVLHNDGKGEFRDPVQLLVPQHYGAIVRFVDLDGDGRPELIAATSMGAKVWKYAGGSWIDQSAGLPKTDGEGQISGVVRGITAMDLDGDGQAELVESGMPDVAHPTVSMYHRSGDGWVPWGKGLPTGESFFDAVFLRLDAKGTKGLALAGQDGVLIVQVGRDGTCKTLGRIAGTAGVLNLAAGDVDGDGADELFVIGMHGMVRLVKVELETQAGGKGAPGR